jgi:hypothetical protein
MSDENENNNAEIIEADSVDSAVDLVTDAVSGIPAPIRKNALKAFAQLCTAAIEIPVAHLEGIAAEKRAETKARIKIIDTQAAQIASQMEVDPEYARVAVKKYGQKIVREQVNLDSIVEIAAAELRNDNQAESGEKQQTPDISQDWLNVFEREACDKSSDEMKLLFGKILAGEVRKPASYSIRTIKLLSQLDNQAANLFHTLASLASTLRVGDHIIDSRVISLGGNAGSNSLGEYGLSFGALNTLQEYGLIISDYNSYMGYEPCIVNDNNSVSIPFQFQGKLFALKRIDSSKPIRDIKVHGVALTKAGKELLDIVDIDPHQKYAEKLIEFFTARGFECVGLSQ